MLLMSLCDRKQNESVRSITKVRDVKERAARLKWNYGSKTVVE